MPGSILSHSSCSRLLISVIIAQISTPVLSSSCYYDNITGRTICDGMSYGARLAIAAAVTILGALVLTGISILARKRFYNSRVPPPVSAGYYGPPPPQTSYPPNAMYVQQPNVYPAAPAYAPPAGPPPPGYNPGYNPYQPKDPATDPPAPHIPPNPHN